MPLAASAVASTAPIGKPAPRPLASAHDVRCDAELLVAPQLAEPADAGLHLVESQQQPAVVANCRSARRTRRDRAHAALALDRLDEDAGGLWPDRALDRLDVAERNLVEAVDRRTEAVEIFLFLAAASVAKVRPWKQPSKVMMR